MRRIAATLAALALTALAPAAMAQDDRDEGRAEAFEAAAEGAETENVPGGLLLVAAYGTTLVLLLLYVVSLGFRQASTARAIDELRRDLAAAERRPPDGPED
ncbi:MAG: hypothetical protein ACFCGT_01290 [Sandaracinaceae bacterium]